MESTEINTLIQTIKLTVTDKFSKKHVLYYTQFRYY